MTEMLLDPPFFLRKKCMGPKLSFTKTKSSVSTEKNQVINSWDICLVISLVVSGYLTSIGPNTVLKGFTCMKLSKLEAMIYGLEFIIILIKMKEE